MCDLDQCRTRLFEIGEQARVVWVILGRALAGCTQRGAGPGCYSRSINGSRFHKFGWGIARSRHRAGTLHLEALAGSSGVGEHVEVIKGHESFIQDHRCSRGTIQEVEPQLNGSVSGPKRAIRSWGAQIDDTKRCVIRRREGATSTCVTLLNAVPLNIPSAVLRLAGDAEINRFAGRSLANPAEID